MGVSELVKAAENNLGSFGENQINVKVVKSQEDKDRVNEHDVHNTAEDREEGEIVDDYEFIISSDEEFCMRQRIEELEATNAELEKIAKISGNSDEYNYVARKDSQLYATERLSLSSIDLINAMDCQRAAQVPTDASSISSVEFPTPRKRKRRKSKASRGTGHEHKQQTSKPDQKHRNETHRGDHKKNKHISRRANMVYFRSVKDLDAHSISYKSSDLDGVDNDSSGCYLSREELRFAVARFSNSQMNSGNLKDRLDKEKNRNSTEISEKYFYTDPKSNNSIQPIVVDDDSSDSVSLEEQELRLIALKSAVMKKHLARKKRDAEVAYSPTDFENVLAKTSYAIRDDEMDVIQVEMDELEHNSRNSMEISPVTSPKLHLSPEEEENSRMSMATEITEVNDVGNTKLVDMDIANSDSEDELPPYDNYKEKWLSLDQIPLPTVRESGTALRQNAIQMAYDGILYQPYSTPIQYTSFLSEHPLEPPPLPPGVTYFEEQPPPPPPFHLDYPPTKLKALNADDKQNSQGVYLRNSQQIYAHNKVKIEHSCTSVESTNERVKFEKGEDDDDEEEEEALRALLLSKFNTPKVWKSKNQKDNLPSKKNSSNDDPEELRGLLLKNIDERNSPQNPTESILKEAVRRLTLKTTSVHLGCVEEDGDNSRSSVGQNSQSSSVELQISALRSNEVSQSTGSSGNGKALILSKGKNGDLPLAFKEIQHNSNLLNFCAIEQSSNYQSSKLDIKKNFVTVRSVEKINESYNSEGKQGNTVISYKSKNDKQTGKNPSLENSLNTVEVLNGNMDEVTHFKAKLLNKDQGIPNEAISNDPDEKPLNAKKDINTFIVENHADTNDNNLNKASYEPIYIENIINTVHAGEKPADVSPKSDTDELAKEKSCEDPIVKTTISTQDTEQNLLASLSDSPSRSTASQDFLKKNVKTNKIFNTQSEIKRKSQDVIKIPIKVLKIDPKPKSSKTASSSYSNLKSSRLITSADISTVQVKKLIISLRASDTETSEEESLPLTKTMSLNQPRFETIEPLICTINNDYYDNASPISLPMDSPGITPKRANSPSGEFFATGLGLTKSFVNDCFKEKLDNFLRNVRTQVQAVSQPIKPRENEHPNTSNSKKFSTPVAVRHLPPASQQEYRRLVHRMQLLEKQKELKSSEQTITVTNTTAKECVNKTYTNNEANKKILQQKVTLQSKQNTPSEESPKSSNGNTLFKKVLLKNANHTVTAPKSNNVKSVRKSTAQQQPSKSNVLRAYENSFLKTGSGIITNLDKSLQLVEEAKQAKMEKLQHEKRLQELRIEMDEIQHKLKQAQQKMSRIYPEICESNEVITTLKQRRSKLLKAATNLGKFIKGDEYRLNNDLKQQITIKSKVLAGQIKLVNSMQYSDIAKVKEMLNQGVSSENSNINQNLHADKSEQKKPHLKDFLTLLRSTAENVSTEEFHKVADSDMLNCNHDETSSRNEETETQERVSRDVPEKNDVISKEVVSEKDDSLTSIEERKMNLVPEYISPLLPLKTTKRYLDPNGIICPYDLMGKCEDKDCNYVHISVKSLNET